MPSCSCLRRLTWDSNAGIPGVLSRTRLGDADMRLSIPRSLRLRSFHSSSIAAARAPDVFTNSLRKTLEAHRSTNRSRLIRKTFPIEDPAGLWRPEIPSKKQPSYVYPVDTPSKQKNRSDPAAEKAIQGTCYPQSPWLRNLDLPRTDAESTLDTEIRALEQYLALNAQEKDHVEKLKIKIASLLKAVVPHTPKVIGSHCTGLALAHSTLDFIIPHEDPARSLDRDRRPSPTRPQIRDAHFRLLRQVEKVLQHADAFATIDLQQKSALSVRHRPTGLVLQFYCGEGIPAITEYLQDYQVEYPALRPLYAVTRTLLEARGLFGSSQASIGPDALAMLIVAFLKMNHGRFPGPNRLGDQFLALLQFYDTQVNIQSVGIAVDPPSIFSASTLPAISDADEPAHLRGQRSLISAKCTAAAKRNVPVAQRLCIQDPTHYLNDLGRSCTRTSELQGAFADAHQQLRRTCDEWTDTSFKGSSILSTVLRANFDELEKMRNKNSM
ncbi:hypothetical protein N7457_006046 [Penicillium paradoxum]|uniref:uncharacterized protein n=1 Tax=Penicillium paradoxum TaxID=176176 RepID=UPI0025496B34|nr:uncharacterized protein N7457_006046 [Penicillium paradoxum]KAJ5780886.1 hypothetical protein N7457_006046 [Penicillium paradoxum]